MKERKKRAGENKGTGREGEMEKWKEGKREEREKKKKEKRRVKRETQETSTKEKNIRKSVVQSASALF